MIEDELRTERQRLHELITNLNAAMLVEDGSRRVILANQVFCHAFALDADSDELVGADGGAINARLSTVFVDPAAFLRRTEEILEGRSAVHGESFDLADGRRLERDYVPVFLDGVYHGHLWQYRDITERRAYEQRLMDLANTDPVTGLPNRRHIMDRLEEELARTSRSDRPATAMLVDIDFFKEINDSHGHIAGDTALVNLSGALRRSLRMTDIVGRIGGDEFLILLPLTDENGAEAVAERLRSDVGALQVPGSDRRQGLSISIGLTPLDKGRRDSRSLLMRADAALYEAKARGRGRGTIVRCAEVTGEGG
ncbi:GGDEF domain-containing protein [Spiribacter curvatus]|uniref:GGDEF domain-containing protein n=1 Tax=Spiribacter curvatus TaxID=1335757 RepID=UPI00040D3366|nr:sensor domain-containing diguanylate cyclase [Spiribacter curvatus]